MKRNANEWRWSVRLAGRAMAAAMIGIAAVGAWPICSLSAAAWAAEPRAEDVLPRGAATGGPRTLADLVEQGRGGAAESFSPAGGPFTPPPAAGPRRPIPPVDRLTAAGRLLEEVFGKKMAAAKGPAEKGKLASEMIEAVRGEPDEAARYAALVQARILAVEARDGRLALTAVRLLAAEFESDAGAASDAERLSRADRLWAEAEKAEGKQRLEKQLEAVGEYWRAAPQSGLTARKWDARIEQAGSAGAIVLLARDATCLGQRLHYNARIDAICTWTDPREAVEWKCVLSRGSYKVKLLYSSRGLCGGYVIAASLIQGNAVKCVLPLDAQTTNSWDNYIEAEFGNLNVKADGEYALRIHAVRKVRHDDEPGIINLRRIILVQ